MKRPPEIVFDRVTDKSGETIAVDAAYVDAHLAGLVGDEDLARYIL